MEAVQIHDLRRPDPAWELLPPSSDKAPGSIDDLRSYFHAAAPKCVRFFENTKQCLEAFFSKRSVKRIALQLPCPQDFWEVFEAHGAQIVELPRDPEELRAMALDGIDLVFMSHPSTADGFYYPEDILESVLAYILSHQKLHLIYDESLRLLLHNKEEISGTVSKAALSERCLKFMSLRAWNGAQSCVLVGDAQLTEGQAPAGEIVALADLELREQMGTDRFFRRLINSQRSLRAFADTLKAPLEKRLLVVPHWPHAGLNLYVECGAGLESSRLYEALRAEGIVCLEGKLVGCPRGLVFNYGRAPSLMLTLGQRVAEIAVKTP
jgi:hypothetical protein